MRVVVFGAHGGTGLLLTRQALDAGHKVVAATRRPTEFPITGERLTVVGADAHDPAAVAAAIQGADAVLSALGVPFTHKPVTTYSEGIANILAGMARHGVKRVVAVSSASTYPRSHAEGGFLVNRVLQPLIVATLGRTTYRDMRRMEELLRASDLEWTVVRPAGLFDAPAPSRYRLEDDHSEGVFTSRADLAASIVDQLETDEWVRHSVAVTTTVGTPTIREMVLTQAFSGPSDR